MNSRETFGCGSTPASHRRSEPQIRHAIRPGTEYRAGAMFQNHVLATSFCGRFVYLYDRTFDMGAEHACKRCTNLIQRRHRDV